MNAITQKIQRIAELETALQESRIKQEIDALIILEDEEEALFESLLAEAIDIGRNDALSRIDQRNEPDCGDISDSTNVDDTLVDLGFHSSPSYEFLRNQALAEFDLVIAQFHAEHPLKTA